MAHRRIRSGGPYEEKVGYSRVVVTDDGWIYLAGTVGQDHATGEIPKDVTEQCRLALGHISAALEKAGASFGDIVRVNYVLPDRRDFEPCWPQLREAFGPEPPTSMMIVAGLADPAMKIEIEVTAKLRD